MTERERARARAFKVACAVTLGLVAVTSVSGCEIAADQFCGVFDDTRYCCDRSGGLWDERSGRCHAAMPVPGPFVPPAERA